MGYADKLRGKKIVVFGASSGYVLDDVPMKDLNIVIELALEPRLHSLKLALRSQSSHLLKKR